MKLNKKVLSYVLVTTMAVSPMMVYAEDTTNEKEAKQEITGEGGLEGWVEEDQFLVTLPTTTDEQLAFKLDPQGLLGRVTDGDTTGTIIFEDDAKVSLTNKSSYDIGFNVTVSLTSSDEELKVITDSAVVATGTDRNIYIAAQPIGEDDAVIEGNDMAVDAVADGADGLVGRVKFAYALKDAYDQYEVGGSSDEGYTFELKADADETAYESVSFGFTGLVNENADWSAYAAEENPETLSLEVSYTVKKLGVEYDDITGGTVEGVEFVEGVTGLLSVEKAPEVAAAPTAVATAEYKKGATVTKIEGITLGSGTLAADAFTSVKVGTAAFNKLTAVPTNTTTKGYMYDADSETLTLYGVVIASGTVGTTTATLTIVYDDAAATTTTTTINYVAAE